MKRLLRVLVAALLLAVGGWWGTRLYLGAKFPATRVQKQFSESLGVPMKVGKVYVDWLGSLTMENVEISDPDGHRTATIRRANYDFSYSSLLSGKIEATGLRLDDVAITLDPTRLEAFQRLPAGKGKDRKYPISLTQGKLEMYEDAGLTKKVAVLSSLQGLLSPSLSGKWSLDLRNSKESVTVNHDASGTTLTTKEWPLAPLLAWRPDLAEYLEKGTFSGNVRPDGLEGELSTPKLSGSFKGSLEAGGLYRLSGSGQSAALGAIKDFRFELRRLESKGKVGWQLLQASFTSAGGTIQASGVWPRLVVLTRGFAVPDQGTVKAGIWAGRLEMSGTDLPSKFRLEGTLSDATLGDQQWKSVPIKVTANTTPLGRLIVDKFRVGEVTGEAWLEPVDGLRGELVLDRPIELASVGGASRGMVGMLSSRLTSMKISGVKLAGTLASPSVSPIWVVPEAKAR